MRILFVYPGDLNTPTGGYHFDRVIIDHWIASGIDVEPCSLSGAFPFPTLAEKQAASLLLSEKSNHDIAVFDGLAGGVLPEILGKVSLKIPVIALVHHPLGLETGLSEEKSKGLLALEAEGLDHVSAIVTTSETTSKTVTELFNFKPEKTHYIEPGVERGEKIEFREDIPLQLLCVGSVIARKDHQLLLKALGQLKHLNWNLKCVGKTDFDPILFQLIEALIVDQKVQDRVEFTGPVSQADLERLYASSDIFVLPSQYEGYGMAYAEAIVRGMPVIGTNAGAIPKTVPEGCGILVESGNVAELTVAIEKMISTAEFRHACHLQCLKSEPKFPTWQRSADRFAQVLKAYL